MPEIHRHAVLCTACIFCGTTAFAAAPTSQPPEGATDRLANPTTQTSTNAPVPTPNPDARRPDLWALNWFGLRPKVEAAGVQFAGSWSVDYSKSLQGGI